MKGPNPKLIFIAGLNNNDETFKSLMEEFNSFELDCIFINLPGQGSIREETETFERAIKVFNEKMASIELNQYGVIAFSTGALYFNLWLDKNPEKLPLFQILLSPAIKLRNKIILEKVFSLLPRNFAIKSLAPKKFRRYHWMKISEYQLLFKLVDEFQARKLTFDGNVKIIIDSRDELVDAQGLQKQYPDKVTLLKRSLGKVTPGMFHALFHPEFWTKEEWKKFVDDLKAVVKNHAE